MTVEQGLDPRDFALLAFGGAGGLHAVAIAEELGMRRVLVPRASGVLSALGLAAADRRVQLQRTVLGRPYEAAAEDLAGDARERLGVPGAGIETVYDCRYHGQSFELTVEDPAAFPDAHEERYGFREDDGVVEVVTVRVTARVPGAHVELAADDTAAPRGARRATALGASTAILRGELPAGTAVEGPAVLALPDSTVAVPAGWAGLVDDTGTLVLRAG
jgi:N-methylhydantoinase A/oxoprolinase/acetone carboxylase beta subunit